MDEYMLTDLQFKDNLRKDKFFNDLIIKALKNNDIQTALEYLQQDNEHIEKALQD